MKRMTTTLALALACVGVPGASTSVGESAASRASAFVQDAGRIDLDVKIRSHRLGRDISVAIYLPAETHLDQSVAERLPVVYLLHGLGDDHTAWPRLGKIKPTLDALIRRGKIKPVLVIMPNMDRSWYVNDARSEGFGPMFDAFRSDLIPAIDARYPTAPCRVGRAIGGLSMGGYGALIHGFAEPRLFKVVFSLSGALFHEDLSEDPIRRRFLAGLIGGVHGHPMDHDERRRWNVFERLRNVGPRRDNPDVWLSTGDDDSFYSILTGTVRAHQMLRRQDVVSELRVDDAGHDWDYWRQAVIPALVWSSAQLKKTCL
ncbi:MAG: alpha/beta hydrolase [Hyphomicrobiaceae bacterium]